MTAPERYFEGKLTDVYRIENNGKSGIPKTYQSFTVLQTYRCKGNIAKGDIICLGDLCYEVLDCFMHKRGCLTREDLVKANKVSATIAVDINLTTAQFFLGDLVRLQS